MMFFDKIPKLNWKTFVLSVVLQFLITSFLYLGIQLPKVFNVFKFSNYKLTDTSPALVDPQPKSELFDVVKTKLEQKENNFQIKKERSLIPTALAGGDHELAASYLVMDLDSGEVLASKDMDQRVAIASLTKIMTAVVALDLASPDEEFVVSPKAAGIIPTKIVVLPGEKMRLEELLHASLMTSANDATEVIEEGIDKKYGQKGLFVRAMNEKARFLGLKNSSFQNPQGFDGRRHFSSAEDLAILSQYALTQYPKILEIVQKDYIYLPEDQNHQSFDLYNWNGLLGVYPGVYGIKIGNTGQAGYTTVVAAQREDKKVLVVLLGAPGVLERDLWAGELLNIGFEKLGIPPVYVSEYDLRAKYSTWR